MSYQFTIGTFVAVAVIKRHGQPFWVVRVEVVGDDGQPSNAWNEGEFAIDKKEDAVIFAKLRATSLDARLFVEILPPYEKDYTAQYI